MKLHCTRGFRWPFRCNSKKKKTGDIVHPEPSDPENALKGNRDGVLQHGFHHQPNRADPEDRTFADVNEIAPSQSVSSVEGSHGLADDVVKIESMRDFVQEVRNESRTSECMISSRAIAFNCDSSASRPLRVKSLYGGAVFSASESRSVRTDKVFSKCVHCHGASDVRRASPGSRTFPVTSIELEPLRKRVRFKNSVEVIPN